MLRYGAVVKGWFAPRSAKYRFTAGLASSIRSHQMKDHLSALLISLALIIAASIFACAFRYSHMRDQLILDHWTGKAHSSTDPAWIP